MPVLISEEVTRDSFPAFVKSENPFGKYRYPIVEDVFGCIKPLTRNYGCPALSTGPPFMSNEDFYAVDI